MNIDPAPYTPGPEEGEAFCHRRVRRFKASSIPLTL